MALQESLQEFVTLFYFNSQIEAGKQHGVFSINSLLSSEPSGRKLNSHSTHFSGNLDCLNSVALKSNRALLVNDNLLLQTKRNVHRGWTILKEMYGKPVSLQMNNTDCSGRNDAPFC